MVFGMPARWGLEGIVSERSVRTIVWDGRRTGSSSKFGSTGGPP